jgi:hypothetical protein
MEACYDGTLEGFFALLADALELEHIPDKIRRVQPAPQEGDATPSLFSEEELGLPVVAQGPEKERKSRRAMERLRACSETVFQDCLQAWMSDEPIEIDIIQYAIRFIKAAERTAAGVSPGTAGMELTERIHTAEIHTDVSRTDGIHTDDIRTDRSWGPCERVLRASQRYLRELDRLLGLLRFKPTKEGFLLARCEPDTFALPGLAEPLRRRFGTTAWAVQDEKRCLVLSCDGLGEPELAAYDPKQPPFSPPEGLVPDEFEALWQDYYEIINIETRKNPELRKRLMPQRYWKYLPELKTPQ